MDRLAKTEKLVNDLIVRNERLRVKPEVEKSLSQIKLQPITKAEDYSYQNRHQIDCVNRKPKTFSIPASKSKLILIQPDLKSKLE